MKKHIYPILLVIIGVLVFYSVLFKGFILDDNKQIVHNTFVRSVSSIPLYFIESLRFQNHTSPISGYTYRPIMFTSYTLLYLLGEGKPFIFHFTLLVVFFANALLVYYFLIRFTTANVSFLLALLFLVHPANQEIATYIADLPDALAFLFGIIALLLIVNKAAQVKTVILCSLSLFLACLSKETGIIFLVMVVLYVYLFQRKFFLCYAGFLGISLFIYLALRIYAGIRPFLIVNTALMHHESLSARLFVIPKVILFYISQMIMPMPRLPLSYLNNINYFSSIVSLLIIIAIFAVVVVVARYLRQKNHKNFTLYLLFLFSFLVSVGLYSQVIPLDVIVAKRWLYIPIFTFLGLVICLVNVLSPLLRNYRYWLLGGYLVYIFILALETHMLVGYY